MEDNDPRLEFLDLLERAESRLLSWGVVEGAFSYDEIIDRAEAFLENRDLWQRWPDVSEFREQMMNAGLLFEFEQDGEPRYRTRMGETVRLLARLRQLFPSHFKARDKNWRLAKPLVGDFRHLIRPRLVPHRTLDHAQVRGRLLTAVELTALQADALAALLPQTLAAFQVRATERVLGQLRSGQRSGSVICAGTGSGKTLAFYLPAFLSMCESIDKDSWTRCLAIYPRNELLKDQLAETWRQARKLDVPMQRAGKRKLSLATLFSATPHGTNKEWLPKEWRSVNGGAVCPYMACPTCHRDLIWRDEDRDRGIERLRCMGCAFQTQPDELRLTRTSLLQKPADTLFTTTEMLNQRLGDSRFGRLFGVGQARGRRPQLVLLDEIHTYGGVSGAQVGLLLRRWKKASGATPHFVGLSATLADANRFFAALIGELPARVEEISPASHELRRVGMETILALRNDPASRAPLLATTIQAVLLLRRVLDSNAPNARRSGVYGTKVFVFTDDLDVTNRLFFNVRDAEGQSSFGRSDPVRHPGGSLANLRRSDLPEESDRRAQGQTWDLCRWLGHSLDVGTASLRIERTSSQDMGVAKNADVVVATAALEVGYNDPEVNVVLQHKAPKDPAQFLQRKGRAGRRIAMRPCTVVILSDYGFDRAAWESFDRLFDPMLAPRELPVNNVAVLRMQIVFAFLDWIAAKLRRQNVPEGSVYSDFSGPADEVVSNPHRVADVRLRQAESAKILDALLFHGEGLEDLTASLAASLDQSPDTIDTLMWEPPRALMTAVLPTLLRRLQSDWGQVAANGCRDVWAKNHPLPEFIPAQLFADLNLPEVAVSLPPVHTGDPPHAEPMPIVQAMREFAPGRVSRRFGVEHGGVRHWIPLPDPAQRGRQLLTLSTIASRFEELGTYEWFNECGQIIPVRCVRPREIRPQMPPASVRDSSNAMLVWRTQFCPRIEGTPVDLPSPSRWESFVVGVEFYIHRLNNALEVRRFTTESRATVVLATGQTVEASLEFRDTPAEGVDVDAMPTVGLGFAIDVDGFVVRHRIPEDLVERVASSGEMLRSLRSARFQHLLEVDSTLDGIANFFQRRWLAQVYTSSLVGAAIERNQSLADVFAAARSTPAMLDFATVLSVVFQSIPVARDDDDPDAGYDDEQQQLQQDLTRLLAEPTVWEALARHTTALWESPGPSWSQWLGDKFSATLGAAVLDAVERVCADLAADDLLLDIKVGPRPSESARIPAPGIAEIWITEATIGGGGVVEAFMARYAEDPRRFFDLVEAALRPSDQELIDTQLTMFLRWINAGDEELQMLVRNVRSAAVTGHQAHAEAIDALRDKLAQRGMYISHSVFSSLNNRILRPGSRTETDTLTLRLLNRWRSLEERLGVEIDPRTIAYHESSDDAIEAAVDGVDVGLDEVYRRQWRFNAIFSLLWPRGSAARVGRLAAHNVFASCPSAERELVVAFLVGEIHPVSLTDDNWLAQAKERLTRDGEVTLKANANESMLIRAALLELATSPVDTGAMLLYPRVARVDRHVDSITTRLVLPEGMQ